MYSPHPRERALQMRLKGHSYNEINKVLNISKSTLSLWLRDVVLSEHARQRLSGRVRQGVLNGLIKRNKMQTHAAQIRSREIRTKAAARIALLSDKDLLLIGAVLYWAEGYKRPRIIGGKERTAHVISFVNSDPEMIKVFINFMRKILGIKSEALRIVMRLYPHINEEEARRYWIKITGLNTDNFHKSSFLITGASKGIRPFNRLPYGTVQIAVNSTEKFHELMGLLDGVKKNLRHDILTSTLG